MTSDKSIPGIYEYCDRWCRTCAFTAHCRLYQEVLSVPVTPQMVAAMRRAAAAMRAMDRLMDEQMARHGRRPRQAARDRARSDTGGRRLVVAAGDYARFVVEWFEGLPRAVRRLPRTATEADPDHPVHVVAYHHVIIGLKLTRGRAARKVIHSPLSK
ncbi:MAG: hypothetical protein AB1635_20060 [Acidobacteriota bacterium]